MPSGFDSFELISISTGFKASSDILAFDSKDYFDNFNKVLESSNNNDDIAIPSLQVELESETEWLGTLSGFVNQGIFSMIVYFTNI